MVTKKKKKTAGRPKTLAAEDVKTEIITGRITKSQKEEIMILFGSMSEFLKQAVVAAIKKRAK